MRYVLVLFVALAAIGCGDDPLAPTPAPVVPPVPTAGLCVASTPADTTQLCVEGRGCILVTTPPRYQLVPCD